MKSYTVTIFSTAVCIFLSATPVSADQVVVNYSATIATLTGSPIFGINPTLGTEVTGFFTYETSTADSSTDPNRGNYEHTFGGAFRADIAGFATTIEGSMTPFVQIENFTSDTFRFVDGSSPFNQVTPDGVMRLNGVDDANIELLMSITDTTGSVFSDDLLPNPFPITMPPVLANTFSLSDGTATMLLQFTSVTPVPEPSAFGMTLIFGALLGIGRRRL